MRIYFTTIFISIFISTAVLAQNYDLNESDEVFFEEDSLFQEFGDIETLNLFGAAPAAKVKTLRNLMPPIVNLMTGKVPTSVSVVWAFTYQAMAMQYKAEQNKDVRLSYNYAFNKLPKDNSCRLNVSSINQLSNNLKTNGTVSTNDFKLPAQCTSTPVSLPNVPHYKIKDIYILFDGNCKSSTPDCIQSRSRDNKINRLKIALTQNKPVVALLKVHKDFHLIRNENLWYSNEKSLVGSKTVVIVGYDDNSKVFEVTFPGGYAWGKNGIAHLKYQDVVYLSKAYTMVLDKPTKTIAQTTPTAPKAKTPSTTGIVKPKTTPSPKPIAEKEIAKEDVSTEKSEEESLFANIAVKEVYLNASRQIVTKPLDISINKNGVNLDQKLSSDQNYQIYINKIKDGTYFYALNLEKDKKQVHFPINKEVLSVKTLGIRPVSSYVISGETDFYIPRPRVDEETGELIQRGFVKRDSDKEYMILIFSKEKLDQQLISILDKLEYFPEANDIEVQLKNIFNVRNIENNYHLNNNEVTVSSEKNSIIPLIIELSGE